MHRTATLSHTRAASEPLSALRVGAWSSALALHLVAFAALLTPQSPLPPQVREATPDRILAEFIARVVPPSQPVPPMPTPPQRPRANLTPRQAEPVPTPVDDARLTLPVVDPMPIADPGPRFDAGPVATSATSDAQIAYLDAPPPPYPRPAIRAGLEGTVLLRVRVDADGMPREARIERSSGHAVLDRAASDHVLRRWRFEPATVDGRPADAWARVPIGFRLDRG